MKLDEYLQKELNLPKAKAYEIAYAVSKYNEQYKKKKLNIKLPSYTPSEEIFNSVSHGIAAVFAVVALVMMVIRATGLVAETSVALFGSTMIILYSISCIYHALSRNLEGKKVLRVIDHCNVYLLVYGTYIPIALVGVGGKVGLSLFGVLTLVTVIGIILTSIKIDKFRLLQIICHLVSGWASLIVIKKLYEALGFNGILFLILGGIMYSIGSVLYGVSHNKTYMHCVFHVFCILGTFFHFWCIYFYVI